VQVLPVLNPSPNTVEGEYSPSALAAINVTNYNQFFFRTAGVDYTADLTSSVITLDYRASGQYLVNITFQTGAGTMSQIFDDEVDDFPLVDPPKVPKDTAGPSRRIATPNADLVLVSTQDPNFNDGNVLDTSAQIWRDAGRNVQRVDSLAAAKNAIQAAFVANGNKKISVILDGHGRPGSIKIGTERINNDNDGTMTPAQFQSMIDQWVSSIEFTSCNTGQDLAFLQTFANSLGVARGYTTTVTASAPGLIFSGYFDVGAGAKKAEESAIPEPATIVFCLAGYALFAALRGTRMPFSGAVRFLHFRRRTA
jgi:hypothetical protein